VEAVEDGLREDRGHVRFL